MKKVLFILGLSVFILSWSVVPTMAQSGKSGWKLSIGGGYMDYYGDVSPYRILHWDDWQKAFKFFRFNDNYIPEASFGLSLEKRFSPGMGLMLQFNKGAFAMSDRYQKPNDDYDVDAPHWDRALNFKTNVYDAGLAITFHSDNGKLLREDAFFAPYLFLGAGLSYFEVKGDLYDADGNPYNYSNPNVALDGDFETDLRDVMTETNEKYDNVVPYADLGIGIKFRLSRVVSLSVQTDVKYSFSDYLDDVSGEYKLNYSSTEQAYAAHPGTNSLAGNRGYNDGVNDIYVFNQVSFQFNLGRKHDFKAPAVYNPGLRAPLINSQEQPEKVDTGKVDKTSPAKDSLKHVIAEDSKYNALQSELRNMKEMMWGMRFKDLDRFYVRKKYGLLYRLSLLKQKRHELAKPPVTVEDSVRYEQVQVRIKEVKAKLKAMEEARMGLTGLPFYGNNPGLIEDSSYHAQFKPAETITVDSVYNDSTDQAKTQMNERHTDSTKQRKVAGNSIQTVYHQDSLVRDSLKQVYQYKLDSLKNVNDSLRLLYKDNEKGKYNDTVTALRRDSLEQAYDALLTRYKDSMVVQNDSIIQRHINAQKDSIRKAYDSLLLKYKAATSANQADSAAQLALREKSDSLKMAYDSLWKRYKKDSMAINRKAKTVENNLAANEQNMRTDSLQRVALQREVDSLRAQKLETLQALDSAKKEKKNFFQRIFKSKQKKETNHADSLVKYRQQINRKEGKMDELMQEMKELKAANQSFQDDLSDVQDMKALQAAYLRAAIDDLNRGNYGGVGFRPTIAPVVTTGRNNDDEYKEQLQDARAEIEELKNQSPDTVIQHQPKQIQEKEKQDSTYQKWEDLMSQLDYLKNNKTLASDLRENRMANLRTQVDSLRNELRGMQVNKEKEPESFNFPVVSTYFSLGSHTMSPADVSKLRPVASWAKKDPSLIILLKAFTDGTGSEQVNKKVSQERANAVKDVLMNKYDIRSSRIQIEPNEKISTVGGKNALKRRVDIRLEQQ